MKVKINVQDQFLNQVRKEHTPVVLETITGKELKGTIRSFDNFSIVLEDEGLYLIYKHAIAHIQLGQGAKLSNFGPDQQRDSRD
ncbi:MAG: RNA chaperone Hfq [Candidatus Alcyoniella australis]|nr:RNA chaperone Hfq [Candidatus Alcyoniella australis]